MNQRPVNQPHRRMTRAEVRRRRRSRAIRRVAGLTAAVCLFVGGAAFLLNRHAPVPSASAASAPAEDAENSLRPAASSTVAETNGNALGLTADEAAAMLADPLMVLVNHANKMPDDYTFETKECGSKTAVNKTLQTVACDAFLEMQKAAAAENVTIWMQSGYRSVKYQTGLYERKTKYYTDQGYDLATAKEKAAAVVNPPGYSEHNCGVRARGRLRVHPALPQGGRGPDRDHLRALALALCGRGKCPEDQRQRPVLRGLHRPAAHPCGLSGKALAKTGEETVKICANLCISGKGMVR